MAVYYTSTLRDQTARIVVTQAQIVVIRAPVAHAVKIHDIHPKLAAFDPKPSNSAWLLSAKK